MKPVSEGQDGDTARQNVEAVHERLREAILHGHLAPGEEIAQMRVAKDFGVSRTPLREALRMLQREGLVEGEPNRSYRVAGFSLPDLEELYVARISLEASAIRITIPRLESEDIARLEGDMAQMAHFAAQRDYPRWEVPHRAFHRGLVARSGPRLATMLSQLSDHTERYRRLYTTAQEPRGWSVGVREHRCILDACAARDADAAAAALSRHLAHTVIGLVEMVDPSYRPEALETALAAASAPSSPKPS